ncbi:aggregation-promoting factor C-terminal-like domain-containing protein [Agromyces soli]
MRNESDLTPAQNAPEAPVSRRSLRAHRLGRRRLFVAGAIAAAGLVVGTGVTLQSAADSQARVEATAALGQANSLDSSQLGAYAAVAEARAHGDARDTLAVANQALADASGKVDTAGLAASVASLGEYEELPLDEVTDLTALTRAETEKTKAAAAEHDRVLAEQAEAQARANTPDGAKATARDLAASQYGWGESQFQCLSSLWQKESGWSYTAYNASSGATGIPQALPGSKMATAGDDWQTNAATQIAWGLDYIARAYGTPCSAWSHSQSMNWY